MQTGGWRSVQFNPRFIDIFRVLLFFEYDILYDSFAFAGGDKLIFHGIALQCSFLTMDHKGPGIFRVRRVSPGTMLPNTVELIEFKDGGLGIGNIGFPILLHINAAGSTDSFGPFKLEKPADGIEHMHAHVAGNTIAIFHKSSPPSTVGQSVVWSHRRRSGPEFIIEVRRNRLLGWIPVGTHMIITADRK